MGSIYAKAGLGIVVLLLLAAGCSPHLEGPLPKPKVLSRLGGCLEGYCREHLIWEHGDPQEEDCGVELDQRLLALSGRAGRLAVMVSISSQDGDADLLPWRRRHDALPPKLEDRFGLRELSHRWLPKRGCVAIAMQTASGLAMFGLDATNEVGYDWLGRVARWSGSKLESPNYLLHWGQIEDDLIRGRWWFHLYSAQEPKGARLAALLDELELPRGDSKARVVLSNDPLFGGCCEFPWASPLVVAFAEPILLKQQVERTKQWMMTCDFDGARWKPCRELDLANGGAGDAVGE